MCVYYSNDEETQPILLLYLSSLPNNIWWRRAGGWQAGGTGRGKHSVSSLPLPFYLSLWEEGGDGGGGGGRGRTERKLRLRWRAISLLFCLSPPLWAARRAGTAAGQGRGGIPLLPAYLGCVQTCHVSMPPPAHNML